MVANIAGSVCVFISLYRIFRLLYMDTFIVGFWDYIETGQIQILDYLVGLLFEASCISLSALTALSVKWRASTLPFFWELKF